VARPAVPQRVTVKGNPGTPYKRSKDAELRPEDIHSWQPRRTGRQHILSTIVEPAEIPKPTPPPVEQGLKRRVTGKRKARIEGAYVTGTKNLGPV